MDEHNEEIVKLQKQVDKLETELFERDEDVQKAAEIGRCLLEQNSELKDKLENSLKQHAEKVEALQQENYSIQLKLDSKTSNEDWFNTEISHLKEDYQQKFDQLKESLDAERYDQVSKLQRKIEDLQSEVEQSHKTERDLQSQIQQLEELVQQGLEQTEIISKSFLNDEIGDLKTELVEVKNENTVLKSQLIEGKSEYQKVKVEAEGLRNKLKAKESELEEVQCQATSYFNSLENSRTEVMDLKAEMEALRMETSCHKKKGNSLFSELEDRRVDAETKFVSLKVQFDSLKEKYEFEKQHHHKLKMQMVVLLQMSKGSADSDRVSQLESRLTQERAEKQDLLDRVHKLEKNKDTQSEVLKGFLHKGDSDGVKVDEDYVQYLLTIVKNKEKEIDKLNDNLSVQEMQLLDKKNNVFSLERKIYDTEAEREKFRCQNLKLKLEIEELKAKLDPESVKNEKKPPQYITEKLQLPDKENLEQSSMDSSVLDSTLSDSVFLPNKTVPLSSIPSNQGNKKCVKTNSKGKSVSISQNVEVKDEDGECDMAPLSEKERSALKSDKQSQSKGRIMTNVKMVDSSKAKTINDCKSQ